MCQSSTTFVCLQVPKDARDSEIHAERRMMPDMCSDSRCLCVLATHRLPETLTLIVRLSGCLTSIAGIFRDLQKHARSWIPVCFVLGSTNLPLSHNALISVEAEMSMIGAEEAFLAVSDNRKPRFQSHSNDFL